MINLAAARALLAVAGLIVAGTGLAILALPLHFYGGYGLDLPRDVSLLNELRGSGGGVTAIGLFLLLGAALTRLTVAAALAGALINFAYAGGRGLALVLDGVPRDGFVMAAAAEAGLGTACLLALFLAIRRRSGTT